MSDCHLITLSHCQIITWSHCHIVTLSRCQSVRLSDCHIVRVSDCQIVTLSHTVTLSECQIVRMSHCHIFTLSECQIVLKKAKRDHVTPLFRKLHWLPLQARIDYKIYVLCFKCINETAPSYLSDLLEQYVPSRLLKSGSQNLLNIPPRANKKCTEKAFKHCASYIWNSLPSYIRVAKSESQFKNDLKTHLFKSHLCI